MKVWEEPEGPVATMLVECKKKPFLGHPWLLRCEAEHLWLDVGLDGIGVKCPRCRLPLAAVNNHPAIEVGP